MALITARRYLVSAAAIPVTIFAHLLVIAVTILVLVWLLHFEKGLAFQSHHNKHKMLNAMLTLLMILGPVLAGGEGKQLLRSQKAFYSILHFTALGLGIMGMYMIFKLPNDTRSRNMYTLHSWLGMIAISSFGLQLFGFFTYCFPGAEKAARAALVPWHVFIGMAIFLLTICTTETGLVEIFIHMGLVHSQEALLVNFIVLLVFLFAVSVSLTLLLLRVHK